MCALDSREALSEITLLPQIRPVAFLYFLEVTCLCFLVGLIFENESLHSWLLFDSTSLCVVISLQNLLFCKDQTFNAKEIIIANRCDSQSHLKASRTKLASPVP